ncbi:proline-rich protein 23B-like [Thomomys bottae]
MSKMPIRSRSPSLGAQPVSPSPAKRLRLDQPEPLPSPEGDARETPAHADGQAQAHRGFSSLVALAAGCALKVPLNHCDVVLDPAPDSILTVNFQDQRLLLVPENVLSLPEEHEGQQGDPSNRLVLQIPKGTTWNDITIQEDLGCVSGPQVALQVEASTSEVTVELSSPELLPIPPTPDANIGDVEAIILLEDFHLSGSTSDSPLQPLPQFPRLTSAPQRRPCRPARTACRARKCLFPDE